LIALLALIGYKFGLGAGDVKLIALLSLFFFPRTPERLIDLVEGFVATSMALIILDRFRGRSFVDSIALAPAICAAFIWCAR
jgi:Flp pilus assembly protein protease CpaA